MQGKDFAMDQTFDWRTFTLVKVPKEEKPVDNPPPITEGDLDVQLLNNRLSHLVGQANALNNRMNEFNKRIAKIEETFTSMAQWAREEEEKRANDLPDAMSRVAEEFRIFDHRMSKIEAMVKNQEGATKEAVEFYSKVVATAHADLVANIRALDPSKFEEEKPQETVVEEVPAEVVAEPVVEETPAKADEPTPEAPKEEPEVASADQSLKKTVDRVVAKNAKKAQSKPAAKQKELYQEKQNKKRKTSKKG